MGSLKKPYEFKEVFSKGQRIPGRYFILFVKKSTSQSCRIGLAVSRKIGSSVERNRVKRLYREALRKVIQEMRDGGRLTRNYDFVFIGKQGSVSAKMTDVYRELKGIVLSLGS